MRYLEGVVYGGVIVTTATTPPSFIVLFHIFIFFYVNVVILCSCLFYFLKKRIMIILYFFLGNICIFFLMLVNLKLFHLYFLCIVMVLSNSSHVDYQYKRRYFEIKILLFSLYWIKRFPFVCPVCHDFIPQDSYHLLNS